MRNLFYRYSEAIMYVAIVLLLLGIWILPSGCASRHHGHDDVYATPGDAERISNQVFTARKGEIYAIAAEEAEKATDALRDDIVDLVTLTSPVLFEKGSALLSGNAMQNLQRKARIMKNHPSVGLILLGRASKDGKFTKNNLLSKARAWIAMQYLIGQGISPDRLVMEFQGDAASSGDHYWDRAVSFKAVELKR